MLVSTKGRYALRVLIELSKAQREEYVPLASIAAGENMSEKYLESIVAILVKAGFVEGLRGKGGGYRLTRDRSKYSVGEILRLTEGTLAPVTCLDCRITEKCERENSCRTLPMWKKLDSLITDYLDSVSLEDFFDENDNNMINGD